jgi:hypothetical protein
MRLLRVRLPTLNCFCAEARPFRSVGTRDGSSVQARSAEVSPGPFVTVILATTREDERGDLHQIDLWGRRK